MKEEMYCAYCGKPIEKEYYKVLDNYLQIKYFETDELNIFCSEECVLNDLFVTRFEIEEEKEEEIYWAGQEEEEGD